LTSRGIVEARRQRLGGARVSARFRQNRGSSGPPFIGLEVPKSHRGWTISCRGVGFEPGFDLVRISFRESILFCFGDKIPIFTLCRCGKKKKAEIQVDTTQHMGNADLGAARRPAAHGLRRRG
jgi:hypothetical protein